MYEPPINGFFRSRLGNDVFKRVGTDKKARKYTIIGEGVELSNRGDRIWFAPEQVEPADEPAPLGLDFIGKPPTRQELADGRDWAEREAKKAEAAGHPHLAEVWRRVAKWQPGDEVRVNLGAYGMADDITRKWGMFWGLTPSGPKHFRVKLGNGKNRNLVIQGAIFDDLYKPRAQALDWERAYDW